jgi:hypothetical protein
VNAVFVELPTFERHRGKYLDDDGFRALQSLLMKHPEAGDPIRTRAGYASSGSEMRGGAKANGAVCE